MYLVMCESLGTQLSSHRWLCRIRDAVIHDPDVVTWERILTKRRRIIALSREVNITVLRPLVIPVSIYIVPRGTELQLDMRAVT